MIISPVQKPEWKDAPTHAAALGVCQIPGDDSYGEWCFLGTTVAKNFSNIEPRPKEKK